MPDQWREGRIAPIWESGDKTDVRTIEEFALRVWPQSCTPTSSRLGFGDVRRVLYLKSNFGFRRGRGCSDAIFILRRVIDQHLVRRRPLHICFIGIPKGYGSVDRKTAWKALPHRGAATSGHAHRHTFCCSGTLGLARVPVLSRQGSSKKGMLPHPCITSYRWTVSSSGMSCVLSGPWGSPLDTPSMVLCRKVTPAY
jgi:hypothetical protein